MFYGLEFTVELWLLQIWDFNSGQSRNTEEPSPSEPKGSTFTFNNFTHLKNDKCPTNVKAYGDTYQVIAK